MAERRPPCRRQKEDNATIYASRAASLARPAGGRHNTSRNAGHSLSGSVGFAVRRASVGVRFSVCVCGVR
jgi:hypothetical protein